jgi:hypothetical protein
MKQISTGTGLVVLSGTILASVLLSSPRTAMTAFASAQHAQPAERSVGSKPDTTAPVAMLSDCDLPPANWFSPQPHMILDCAGGYINSFGKQSISMADVNGDSSAEYFIATPQSEIPPAVYYRVSNNMGPVLFNLVLQQTSNGPVYVKSLCCSLGFDLGNALLAMIPNLFQAGVVPEGFRDCDGDGDLDLIFHLYALIGDTSKEAFFWLENTGFQRTAPIEGDLNHDGQVDNADVGVLLINFDA